MSSHRFTISHDQGDNCWDADPKILSRTGKRSYPDSFSHKSKEGLWAKIREQTGANHCYRRRNQWIVNIPTAAEAATVEAAPKAK